MKDCKRCNGRGHLLIHRPKYHPPCPDCNPPVTNIKRGWRTEFQYLLDRKILTRDELAYLFGQIKSIVDFETEAFRKALKEYGGHSDYCAVRQQLVDPQIWNPCTCGFDAAKGGG